MPKVNSFGIQSSTSGKLNNLIAQLQKDFSSVKFKPDGKDYWSASQNTVYYDPTQSFKKASYSLLHELGHSQLDHIDYGSDFELIRMEAAAWHEAQKMGQKYGIYISEEHIQSCLDSYRDWLHARSRCPECSAQGAQASSGTYKCYNCGKTWKVTAHRLTRPYRKTKRN